MQKQIDIPVGVLKINGDFRFLPVLGLSLCLSFDSLLYIIAPHAMDGQKICCSYTDQGCQMVCFQTKNPNLGKFGRVLLWKILVYFMTIWSILRPLEILYGHLVYFVVIWYIFPHFGILDQEKSGNTGLH
jgi:hypothetical protein